MRKVLAIVWRDAKLDMSYPGQFAMQWVAICVGVSGFYFVSKLVRPNGSLGFGGHASTYFSYVIVNVAFMVLLTNAVQGFGKQLRRDQFVEMIEPIFATPTPVGLIVFSYGIWKLLLASMQAALYLMVASLFFGLDLRGTDIAALGLFTILSVACMAAIGVIGAGVVIYSKTEPPSNFIVGGAGALLSGVLFPIALLPHPLRILSWLLPMTHALHGLRGATRGATLSQLSGDAIWLAIASAILLPVAFFAFNRSVDHARTDGTLAHS